MTIEQKEKVMKDLINFIERVSTENFRKLDKADKQQVIAFMLGMIAAGQNRTA